MRNITRTTFDMVKKGENGLENLTGLVRERTGADTRVKEVKNDSA